MPPPPLNIFNFDTEYDFMFSSQNYVFNGHDNNMLLKYIFSIQTFYFYEH